MFSSESDNVSKYFSSELFICKNHNGYNYKITAFLKIRISVQFYFDKHCI